MCDYSLMTVPNRLAEMGEELITYKFPIGSLGFTSLADWRKLKDSPTEKPERGFWSALKQTLFDLSRDPHLPAVCIPPGARLRLQDIPACLQEEFGIGPVEEVTFTELTATPNTYRDAIVFENRRHILLQKLEKGQCAKVLELSSAEAGMPYEEWLASR